MPDTVPSPFRLRRWFAAIAFGSIAVVAGASAWLLSSFLTEYMLRRDAEVSLQFIESIIEASGARPYLLKPPGETRADLIAIFAAISHVPDVERAVVYAADRSVLWSSETPLIGRQLGPNPDLDRAFAGEIEVEMGLVGRTGKPEHQTFGPGAAGIRFVENYLPIWDEPRSRVIGVVELYKLPSALFRAIADGHRWVWIGAGVAGAFLFATLFWMVAIAERIMRRQERQLRDAQSWVAIGELASAVAHAIRNPLASMRSSAELVQELHPETREYAKDIMSEADRLTGWVTDLLRCARFEAGPADDVDVGAALRNVIAAHGKICERHKVAVRLRLADTLPHARVGGEALDQVIGVLIDNAVQAMPQGGHLDIAASAPNRRTVLIEIADSGQGIAPEMSERLFQPYASGRPGGLGIGLALSRRILERYGGTIDLGNAAAGGARAIVQLVAAAAPAAQHAGAG